MEQAKVLPDRTADDAPSSFSYDKAFARNIGWLTPEEQQSLRGKRVAIAGVGGVGGGHAIALARLGIGAMHISDLDIFEVANMNRQVGAFVSTMGRDKVEVVTERVLDVNPQVDVQTFPTGVSESNVEGFLKDVDVYVDGLDYFALSIRKLVFKKCYDLGIPAVTAAPMGMGAAVLNFLPGKMSFEEYFRLDGQPEEEQLVRFLVGLSPAMLQQGYLVHPDAVDFAAQKGPSTIMACDLCSGIAVTQTLKILLGRGGVLHAPWGLHFDAYRDKLVKTWRPGGNNNPIQRVALAIARRKLAEIKAQSPRPE